MSIQAIGSKIGTKIVSTLGNKESLIPIMIKDGVDSTALTVKSFKEGGAVEGMDRFIDEFGTQAIWIGGIPFYKKVIDWTAYKAAKINPGVDPRIIANPEYSKWAVENAKGIMSNSKTQTVKSAISDFDAHKVKATSEVVIRMELWNKTYVDSNSSSTNY